jgi:N6-adenosine-specific RNA methylase IME4
MQRYRTIVIDPPWKYGAWGRPSGRGSRAGTFRPEICEPIPLPYQSISLSEISALPIPELADIDCELYVWTTQKYLPHTFPLLEKWGFKYCETLTWCKEPRGTGQGGLFTPTTEFIVHGRIGKMPKKQRVNTTWWKVTRPQNSHSTKPESFQDVIEQVSDMPRLEMFARRYRLGWDAFGNEVDSHVDLTQPNNRLHNRPLVRTGKNELSTPESDPASEGFTPSGG